MTFTSSYRPLYPFTCRRRSLHLGLNSVDKPMIFPWDSRATNCIYGVTMFLSPPSVRLLFLLFVHLSFIWILVKFFERFYGDIIAVYFEMVLHSLFLIFIILLLVLKTKQFIIMGYHVFRSTILVFVTEYHLRCHGAMAATKNQVKLIWFVF